MLYKIAKLFGVSVSDILGDTKIDDIEASAEEQPTTQAKSDIDPQLIALLTKLNPAQVQRVLDFASGMVANNE